MLELKGDEGIIFWMMDLAVQNISGFNSTAKILIYVLKMLLTQLERHQDNLAHQFLVIQWVCWDRFLEAHD